MKLSRILLLIGAVALPALPAAAQGKALGKPAGVGKPTTTAVKAPKAPKTTSTATKGKSADHAKSGDHAKGPKTTTTDTTDTTETTESNESKGRGQLPLNEKIALNSTLKGRLDALLIGGTMTFDEATTGWKNQGQLVAAMNAAQHNPGVSFLDLKTEMTGPNQLSLGKAVEKLKALVPPPTPTTTTTTVTTP